MSAGTIKLTNASQAVTGTGTVFQTDLKAGDVIYAEINGTPYNVIVGSIESNTALTLVDKFSGPTAASLPWQAYAARTMGRISQQLSAKISAALQNSENALNAFQQLLTQTGDVTITAINGQQFTGASWQKISKLVNDADLTRFTALAATMSTQYNQVNTWQQQVSANATAASTKAGEAATSATAAAGSAQTATTKAQEAAASAAAGKVSQDAARVSELNAAQYDSTKAVVNRGLIADGVNINTFGVSQRGIWLRSTPTGGSSLGYPSGSSGVLEVFDGGYYGLTQRWTAQADPGTGTGVSYRQYMRTLTAAWNGSNGPWGPWVRLSYDTPSGVTENEVKFRALGTSSYEWQTSDRLTSTMNVGLASDGTSLIWNYAGKANTINFNNLKLDNVGALYCANIEIKNSTPFIDFHHANNAGDYTHRLWTTDNDTVELLCPNSSARLRVQGGYGCRAGIGGGYQVNYFNFTWNLDGVGRITAFIDNTNCGDIQTITHSDRALKKDIEYVEADGALAQVQSWKAATFKYKARGIIEESGKKLGFIANDMVEVSPECVEGKGLPDDYDIEEDPNMPGAYSLDQVAIIAKLTMAVQELAAEVEKLKAAK